MEHKEGKRLRLHCNCFYPSGSQKHFYITVKSYGTRGFSFWKPEKNYPFMFKFWKRIRISLIKCRLDPN